MSWQCLQHNPGQQRWLWWPGWGFKPQVFEHLYQQLPGQHWGLHYPADDISAADFVSQAVAELPAQGIWVGWSLGGALACQAAVARPEQSPQPLISLATGRRFVGTGMSVDDYQAFTRSLQQQPARTAQRFLALACRGASDARQRARQLANYQIDDGAILLHTLPWLEYQELADIVQAQHWCGRDDALAPTGFDYQLSGSSHAFFAGSDQAQVLARLKALIEGHHES